MNTKKDNHWVLQLAATATVYGLIIWFTMPPDDRMYITLQAMQAYRRYAWSRWVKRTPGWLVEALQVRGQITLE
jgi:hypothetical protein